jgi:tetratricopeptide (TPR) repeat protein
MFEIVAAVAIALQRFHETAIEANRLFNRGEYRHAEERYGDALSHAVSLGDRSHPVALTQNNLAALYYRVGRYHDARRGWEASLEIWRKLGRRADQASVLSNLGELAIAQGRAEDGLALVKQASAIQRDLGQESVNTQLIHAGALRVLGKHKESAAMLRRLLAQKNPPAVESRASILLALAQVDLSRGNFAEAYSEAEEAAALTARNEGLKSYAYAFALFLRGRAHQGAGDWAAAERDLRESLLAHEESVGPNHPRLVALLADLAELEGRRGKPAEALADLDRARRIQDENFGTDHPDYPALLLAAAHQRRRLGQTEMAADLYRQALASASRFHQPSSPAMGPYLNGVAASLFDLGRLDEAEANVRLAISVSESNGGAIHPGMAESYRSLATILMRHGALSESKTMLESCLAVLQHLHGDMHEALLEPLVEYAAVLEKSGEPKRAKKIQAKAAAIAATLPEQRHTVSVDALRSFR